MDIVRPLEKYSEVWILLKKTFPSLVSTPFPTPGLVSPFTRVLLLVRSAPPYPVCVYHGLL